VTLLLVATLAAYLHSRGKHRRARRGSNTVVIPLLPVETVVLAKDSAATPMDLWLETSMIETWSRVGENEAVVWLGSEILGKGTAARTGRVKPTAATASGL
jgi:hypothetical protein